MVDVTLVELHLEDASFTAKAPFSSGQGEDRESHENTTEVPIGEGDGGGPSKLLLAVMGLGIVGALGWWLRRGQMPELDEEIEVAP